MTDQQRDPVLLLSTADWNTPLWTNKQYAAIELAQSYDVQYVNSIGLRRPRFTVNDLRRVIDRVSGAASAGAEFPGVTICSPHVLPLHGISVVDLLNRLMVGRQFRTWKSATRPILWTYSPVTFGLERYAKVVVYHCVDFLAAQEGFDRAMVRRAERALIQRADLTIVSSTPLLAHVETLGARCTKLMENVADTDLFGAWSPTDNRDSSAVFAGNLKAEKVDFKLLLGLVTDARIPLHVAGPIDQSAAQDPDLRQLLKHDLVTYHGTLRPTDLAELFQRCSLGLVPYRLNAYTEGVFPMKVYEYLAAGLPVVATPLASLAMNQDVVTADARSYVRTVETRLHTGTLERERLREAARERSWTHRGRELRNSLDAIAARLDPTSSRATFQS